MVYLASWMKMDKNHSLEFPASRYTRYGEGYDIRCIERKNTYKINVFLNNFYVMRRGDYTHGQNLYNCSCVCLWCGFLHCCSVHKVPL